jgi:hypothetical protein
MAEIVQEPAAVEVQIVRPLEDARSKHLMVTREGALFVKGEGQECPSHIYLFELRSNGQPRVAVPTVSPEAIRPVPYFEGLGGTTGRGC